MAEMLHEKRGIPRNWNSRTWNLRSRCYLLVFLIALFALSGCGGQTDDDGSAGTTGTGATGTGATESSVTEAPLEATDDPAAIEDATGTSVREATETPLEAEEELAPQGTVVTVQRATGGDTFLISPAIEGKNEVKLIGVDAPEAEEPFGDAALAQASSTIEGRKVALGFDDKKTDDAGRILAYVRLPGGDLFNEFMVLAGYAQVNVSPPNTRYAEDLQAAQQQARDTETGIWGLPPDQLCQLADDGNGIGGGC